MSSRVSKKDLYLIQRCIRQQFTRSDYYKRIKAKYISDKRGKRNGLRLKCGVCCRDDVLPKEWELHHIDPVIELDKHYYDYSFNAFFKRVYCSEENLLGICSKCHSEITNDQNGNRKTYK